MDSSKPVLPAKAADELAGSKPSADLEAQEKPADAMAGTDDAIRQTFVDPAVVVTDTSRVLSAGSGALRFNPVVSFAAVTCILLVTIWASVHKPCDIQTLGTCSDSSIDRMDHCNDIYSWVAASNASCVGCVGDDCATEAACKAKCGDGCSDTFYPHHSETAQDLVCPCPCPEWEPAAAAHCAKSDGTTHGAAAESDCTQARTWTVDPDAATIEHWNGTDFEGSHRGCGAAGTWFRTQHKVVDGHDWSASQQVGRLSHWAVGNFNWLNVMARNLFLLVLGWAVYKHGDLKLGESAPEYSTASWLGMLFTTSMGVGLLIFSVADPIANLAGGSDAEAQAAISANFHHFGLHAWCCYSLVGLAVGLASHRWGLPLTIKSAFFPLIGNAIFGWVGDLIDLVALLTTFFGLAASLGFAAMQINSGLHELSDGIAADNVWATVLIWALMLAAGGAIITGVKRGMEWLCAACFCVGTAVLCVVFLMGNSWYLLSVLTQSTGHYMQWVLTLGTDTNAFGITASIATRDAATAATAAGDAWTTFYWGWWAALAPAAGIFIASISKGRTIREFVTGTLLLPTLYCFAWMAVFGGAAIELQRNAVASGLAAGASDMCAQVETSTLVAGTDGNAATSVQWLCGTCPIKEHVAACAGNEHCAFLYANHPGELTNMAGRPAADTWYDLLGSHGQLGGLLSLLSVLAATLYFITTAAAGAHVVDSIAANGGEGSAGQRAFWAAGLAAAATALLHAGGSDAFAVVMRAAAVAGLPVTVMLALVCLATVRGLRLDAAHASASGVATPRPEWTQELLGPITAPSRAALLQLGIGCLAPFVGAGKAAQAGPSTTRPTGLLTFGLLGAAWTVCVVCHLARPAVIGMWALGWTAYLGFATAAAAVRSQARSQRGIDGSFGSDLAAAVFAYPLVAAQLAAEADAMAAAAAAPATAPAAKTDLCGAGSA